MIAEHRLIYYHPFATHVYITRVLHEIEGRGRGGEEGHRLGHQPQRQPRRRPGHQPQKGIGQNIHTYRTQVLGGLKKKGVVTKRRRFDRWSHPADRPLIPRHRRAAVHEPEQDVRGNIRREVDQEELRGSLPRQDFSQLQHALGNGLQIE